MKRELEYFKVSNLKKKQYIIVMKVNIIIQVPT